MALIQVYPHRIPLFNNDGTPKQKTDKEGKPYYRKDGTAMQDTKVEYFTARDGQGTKVESIKIGTDANGQIAYFDAKQLTEEEDYQRCVNNSIRFFCDTHVTNRKGNKVLRKGLIHRFKDIVDNMCLKAESQAVIVELNLAKGVMFECIKSMQKLEKTLMQPKGKKEKVVPMIGLEQVLANGANYQVND